MSSPAGGDRGPAGSGPARLIALPGSPSRQDSGALDSGTMHSGALHSGVPELDREEFVHAAAENDPTRKLSSMVSCAITTGAPAHRATVARRWDARIAAPRTLRLVYDQAGGKPIGKLASGVAAAIPASLRSRTSNRRSPSCDPANSASILSHGVPALFFIRALDHGQSASANM